MKTQTSNRVLPLTRSDDCECDDCGVVATLRVEVPTNKGLSTRDFCNTCYKDYTHEQSQRKAG